MKKPWQNFPVAYDHSEAIAEIHGMTLLDYFAAKAMQGWVINLGSVNAQGPTDADLARYAYDMAEAMLEERETRNN